MAPYHLLQYPNVGIISNTSPPGHDKLPCPTEERIWARDARPRDRMAGGAVIGLVYIISRNSSQYSAVVYHNDINPVP